MKLTILKGSILALGLFCFTQAEAQTRTGTLPAQDTRVEQQDTRVQKEKGSKGQRFERADTNKDGVIDRVEYKAFKQAKQVARKKNPNQAGKVQKRKKNGEANYDKRFDKIDSDNNGVLSREELKNAKKRSKKRGKAQQKRIQNSNR